MKKFLAMMMAIAMMLSCVACAEEAKDPMEIDRSLDARLNVAWAWKVTEENPANAELPKQLTGEWALSAAYISADFIDEFEIEGVEAGLIPVTPGAIKLTINALLDHCASDASLGQITDQGNYFHDHVYCMEGTMTFADFADEKYTLKSNWDEYSYQARGEMDGDYNYGPAKTKVKGDDDLLHWTEITGVAYEDQEEMKHIFMNTSGQLVLCYADKNICNEKYDGKYVGIAYIFDQVVEEVPAE